MGTAGRRQRLRGAGASSATHTIHSLASSLPPSNCTLILSSPPPSTKTQGDLAAAIAAYDAALAAAPNLTIVQLNAAAALTEWGTRLKAEGALHVQKDGACSCGGTVSPCGVWRVRAWHARRLEQIRQPAPKPTHP